MKIIVGNQDRSQELGRELQAAAGKRTDRLAPKLLVPAISALNLRDVSGEAEYFPRFIEHLRIRHGLDTDFVGASTRSGLVGSLMTRVKRMLWRLLRPQMNQLVNRQNLLNELLIQAIEMQHKHHDREVEALQRRIEELEGRAGSSHSNPWDK